MAIINSGSEQPSFAVSYGFTEGNLHSRRLRKQLRAMGFRQAPLASADIIVAHSTGCCLIPQSAQPKLVIYIGMPLVMARPRKAWVQANLANFKDGHIMHNIAIRLKNTGTGLRHPWRNVSMLRKPIIGIPSLFPKAQSVFIANRDDPWPRGPELDSFIASKPWAFISLSGAHDNVWNDSIQYLNIINHYAKLLA